MVRRARFSRASRRRENNHRRRALRRERTTSLFFFPLGFENAIRARVTSSGLPFPPIPPAPSSTDRDPFPPRAGTPQARQIGATRGRAGTPKRTPRRTRASRRPEFLRERRFRKTRAISAAVRHSCRRSKRASPPVADARSRLRTRRARSRASPNPNAPDPPNPAPARVRRSPRTPARASGRARRRARSRIDICDDEMTATTRHSRRDIASSLRPRLELTIDGSLFGSLFDTPR